MPTKNVTKNSSTASAVPTASDLVQGELAVNVADKRLFTENNAGAIVELGTNPTTLNVNGTATMSGVEVSDTDDIRIRLLNGATFKAGIQVATTAGDMIAGSAVDDLAIRAQTNMLFATGGNTERVRISSAGHTTFGTANLTPADSAVNGTSILSDGRINHNAQSQPAAVIGRTGTDGTIVDLRKNGATIGSIGVNTSGLYIADAGVGFRFDSGGTDDIIPCNATGGAADASINLGSSGARFNNLYLSGDVVLGASDGYVFGNTNGVNIRAASGKSTIFDTAGSERMRIDASGNVGIGTSSPAAKLDISGVFQFFDDTTPELRIVDSDDNNYALIGYTDGTMSLSSNHGNEAGGADVMQFLTGGSERMRIDTAGNLLVGKTTTAIGTQGIRLEGNNGKIEATRSGNVVTAFNRTGSDGTISEWMKDGASVGSIGVSGGNNIYISGTQTNHAGLTFATDAILPTRQGVGIDNVTDLGAGSERFKDLYLSGTASMGGLSISNASGGNVAQFTNTSDADLNINLTSGVTLLTPSTGILAFGTSSTERMRIDSAGSLLVNTTVPLNGATKLSINQSSNGSYTAPLTAFGGGVGYHLLTWLDGTAAYIGQNSTIRALRLFSGSGSAGVNLANGATSWGTFSDERLKENIEPIENALESLSGLRTVKYHLKDVDGSDDKKKLGLVAQDLVGVLDEILDPLKRSDDETEYMSVRYTEMVPVLVKAIQEQQTLIESLTTRIAALEE